MPNRWESSARPLFVKTVFVNGNRHAILFEEDPLLRYGNSPYKKISRSNSSLSFFSDRSLTSSESQESNSDERVPRLENSGRRQRKDLSSELQSCLIKLQLPSGNPESGSRSDEQKCCCDPKEEERSQEHISKQRKHKGKRGKTCRRKHCEHFQQELTENKSLGEGITSDGSCYFYNFESTKRKKNYCVVKISSQPPQFTVSCRCAGDLGKAVEKCRSYPGGTDNVVISATVHNLFLTSRREKLSGQKSDKAFLCENLDSIDLCWNSYLTKSYYNSLSERVFQWLDLASRKKSEKQKMNPSQEGDPSNSIERICSGKTFADESKKTDFCHHKIFDRARKGENESNEEIVREPNTATKISAGTIQDYTRNCFRERSMSTSFLKSPRESQKSVSDSIQSEHHNSNPSSEADLKCCSIHQVNTCTPRKPPLKVQDLLLDYNFREKFVLPLGKRSKRKMKETRDCSTFRNKHGEPREVDSTEEEEENNTGRPFNRWKERLFKRAEQTPCQCNRIAEGYADKIKNNLLTEGFSERNQKPINNLNFTRRRPVLIQNLLPSQQPQRDEISDPRTDEIVWGSEKDTGRPQLHIFMPSLLLKDGSDDSMSECENVLNLC